MQFDKISDLSLRSYLLDLLFQSSHLQGKFSFIKYWETLIKSRVRQELSAVFIGGLRVSGWAGIFRKISGTTNCGSARRKIFKKKGKTPPDSRGRNSAVELEKSGEFKEKEHRRSQESRKGKKPLKLWVEWFLLGFSISYFRRGVREVGKALCISRKASPASKIPPTFSHLVSIFPLCFRGCLGRCHNPDASSSGWEGWDRWIFTPSLPPFCWCHLCHLTLGSLLENHPRARREKEESMGMEVGVNSLKMPVINWLTLSCRVLWGCLTAQQRGTRFVVEWNSPPRQQFHELPTKCNPRPREIPWVWPSEAVNELSTSKNASI